MKITKLLTIAFFIPLTVFGQIIEPAPEDKSVVYLVRQSGLGVLINFTYFDGDKLIGKFNGQKYLRYECEPGEHVFWARSENRSFVKANLAAGKIYVIEAIPQLGAIKAGVQLQPLHPQSSGIKRIQKFVTKRESQFFEQKELDKMSLLMKDAKERGLKKLEQLERNGHVFKILHPSMSFEPSQLVYVKPSKPKRKRKAKDKNKR